MIASEAYRMLGNETVWKTATECSRALTAAGIPHAILGGVAVCLHGYQRNTVDVDFLVRRSDSEAVRTTLVAAGCEWREKEAEFLSSGGSPVHLVMAAEPAGKGSEVLLPDPADEKTRSVIEGLSVLTLARLIESKLACGEADLRRTHKDFADVVELIDCNGLDASFAGKLHKSVRPRFKELASRVR